MIQKFVKNMVSLLNLTVISLMVWGIPAFAVEAMNKSLKPVPESYADKHMPKGWWTNQKIIEEGKVLFETATLEYVYRRKKRIAGAGCATCHAISPKTDRPMKRGATDFRSGEKINRFSDSYWFWRVSEGVDKTSMPAWKDRLSEEERWKVIAYVHTWSHGNEPAVHEHGDRQ